MHTSIGELVGACCPPGWLYQGWMDEEARERRGCCSPDASYSLSKIDKPQYWIKLKDRIDKRECVDVQFLRKDVKDVKDLPKAQGEEERITESVLH